MMSCLFNSCRFISCGKLAVGEDGSLCSLVECLRGLSIDDGWDRWQLTSAFCSDSLIGTCLMGLSSASVGAHFSNTAVRVFAVIVKDYRQ